MMTTREAWLGCVRRSCARRRLVVLVAVVLGVTATAMPRSEAQAMNVHACTQQFVLSVSTGRTGSTLHMQALSAFQSTFAIPEPFRYWRQHPEATDSPSYMDLFSCNFLKHDGLTRRVFWVYACSNNRVIAHDKELLKRCKRSELTAADRALLFDVCARACVKIVKTIRFTSFPLTDDDAQQLQLLGHLHMVHLVRQPWNAVVSKHKSGWRYDPTEEGIGGALRSECKNMLQTTEIAHGIAAPPMLTLWHEDLVSNMTASLTFILGQLRWNKNVIDHTAPALANHLSKHEFAALHRKHLKPLNVTQEQALTWIKNRQATLNQADPCVAAYKAFNYAYPEERVG
ncbi:hypothetical protein PTSG_08666 [Salpingoeca rosetta]|uniref:Sulfotransferase domain-containing protein n=1 Tax=Salpingoeca rosetta (strain ATCC 50818 / BSB-021) TaxID=946362 RepID=F2UKB9_SALR5|nr:uncharacterized protein PTSG_08666 [Salpingoeca rosetta]EGD77568.1 hypothetical protein PTSG_08666 [Salpingoeca rosetta]|eukprot:XP_004990456.1 hypothetical protein PTSG_08666 [Salpingoeca rosetta]